MNRMTEAFYAEAFRLKVVWCRGCESRASHKRGFANVRTRTIHLDSTISTRAGLYRALHELGHIADGAKSKRRWERERAAEEFARTRMRALGFVVPRKQVADGNAYVARMKRWGDNVSAGQAS